MDRALLIAGLCAHACVTFALLWRRAWQNFPFFVVYQGYATSAMAIRVALFPAVQLYYYVYWWSELGFLLLAIASAHEVFRHVFSGFYLLPWFRWFYYGGISLAVVLAAINSVLHPPVNMSWLEAGVLTLAIVINCLQVAIFSLFYVLTKVLDVNFRRYVFGIALGLGIASAGSLIAFVGRSKFGTRHENFVVYAPTVAYFVSLLIWLSAFLKAEPEEQAITPPMRPEEMAEEVGQYIAVLKSFFGKKEE
jgi:hypothetical protein